MFGSDGELAGWRLPPHKKKGHKIRAKRIVSAKYEPVSEQPAHVHLDISNTLMKSKGLPFTWQARRR